MPSIKFEVWCPDLGSGPEDALEIYAADANDAATEWARWQDQSSADYSIVGGQDMRVMVRRYGDETAQEFMVHGEPYPVYTAQAVPDQT